MSEQKVGYMAQLDAWADANVIAPLFSTEADEESDWETQVAQVKTAIREKILESYRNGCKAGAGHVRREYRQPAGQPPRKQPSYATAQVR